MREFIYCIAGLAGAAMLTALAVLYAPELRLWVIVFYISAAILALCAGGLSIDIIRGGAWRDWIAGRLPASRLGVILAALILTGGMLWADYWYFSNYSTNGGVWHLQIGMLPPAAPAPTVATSPEATKPASPAPWVSSEEIEKEQKAGRALINYSPSEILEMWSGGRDVNAYVNKWIKINYLFGTLTFDTLDKKQYYMVRMSTPREYVSAYFDQKKWEQRLVLLRPKDRVQAYCLFRTISNFEYAKGYFVGNLIASDCDLL